MFLNLNNEQQHALDAAKQAFGPMLEGLANTQSLLLWSLSF